MKNKDPENPNTVPTAAEQPAQGGRRRGRAGAVSSGLALILSIVALLASAYLGYNFIQKRGLYRADVFSRLDKLEDQSAQTHDALAAATQQLGALKETQDTLQAAMNKVSTEFGKGRRQWLLSETEQLLLIANHRLQLAHDVKLSLGALRAADEELQELADPRYLPVRRTLAHEIGTLESLDKIDVSGMALRLGDIAQRLDELPLAPDARPVARPAKHPADQGRSQLQEMWHDLIGLIRIRRTDEVSRPLLPPDQAYFLRQNLRLMLYNAQTSLLQGDAPVFNQDLSAARDWLKTYYDNSAAPVQAVQHELKQMLNSKFRSRLPDISGSLELLRRIREGKSEP